MNPTRSFPNAQPSHERLHKPRKTRGAQAVCEMPAAGTRHGPARKRGLLSAAALCALCCVALAGCDGSSSGSSASGSSGSPAAANNAAAGAGGASAAVPIVAAPASGACAALGASAVQPLQNTQLVCAP